MYELVSPASSFITPQFSARLGQKINIPSLRLKRPCSGPQPKAAKQYRYRADNFCMYCNAGGDYEAQPVCIDDSCNFLNSACDRRTF